MNYVCIEGEVQWRQLYVDSVAGWELVGHLEPPVVGFLHASLSPDGERLALVAADATVAVCITVAIGPHL